MVDMNDIRKKNDAELAQFIQEERDKVREERFKAPGTRKASVIHSAKQNIARALTEANARRNATNVK